MSTQSAESKILPAAQEVFLRYGYKRTTMADIANAAKISRPALYLKFSSKEDVFDAVMKRLYTEQLANIQSAIDTEDTVLIKLSVAFEIWCVRPFEIILTSPDAKDLLDSSYSFANEATQTAWDEFEKIITKILKTHVSKQEFTAKRTAHVLIGSVSGLKNSASSVLEFRELIKDLLILTFNF